ncbi:DUF2970 domain-containing protein [Ramlibacter sp. CGMCC 1.13660]|nr:DUF2970 domain-containing protein [Ramlibacter sp. CGMCC 1.13660]
MSMFRQIKMVAWSFFGIAPSEARGETPPKASPLVLLLVAFALVLLFLGTLAFIAHSVVAAEPSEADAENSPFRVDPAVAKVKVQRQS